MQVLQLIFNLTLAESGQWFKLKTDSELIRATLVDLHHLGLITMKRVSDPSSKFCVNTLLKTFLNATGNEADGANDMLDPVQKQKFIIVESNFKVYAYTDSRLYQAILRLFMREDYRFPNLVVGMLTRESCNEAFRKKISAQ